MAAAGNDQLSFEELFQRSVETVPLTPAERHVLSRDPRLQSITGFGPLIPDTPAPSDSEAAEIELQAQGLGLLALHPDWPVKRIADALGIDRKTPYKWKRFKEARKALKATNTIPRGKKHGTTGIVEAWDDESPGDGD